MCAAQTTPIALGTNGATMNGFENFEVINLAKSVNAIQIRLPTVELISHALQCASTLDMLAMHITPMQIELYGGSAEPPVAPRNKRGGSHLSLVIPNTACPVYKYGWEQQEHLMYFPKAPFVKVLDQAKRTPGCEVELLVTREDQCQDPLKPFFHMDIVFGVKGRWVRVEHAIPQSLEAVARSPHGPATCENGHHVRIDEDACDTISQVLKHGEPTVRITFGVDDPSCAMLQICSAGVERTVRTTVEISEELKWTTDPCTKFHHEAPSGGFLKGDLVKIFSLWKSVGKCANGVHDREFGLTVRGLNYNSEAQSFHVALPLYKKGQGGQLRLTLHPLPAKEVPKGQKKSTKAVSSKRKMPPPKKRKKKTAGHKRPAKKKKPMAAPAVKKETVAATAVVPPTAIE